ncbi:claudin-4-like [Triplophysa dalaica]|uniref:claudin-4-like n=1 Tax=Triplophysa dalaica TaxID=1582913 RepID=UPI0024DF5087|nr:claudin-4-like [Triplophysa dalaica]
MASMGMQSLGCIPALFGWVGVIIACALPIWRLTSFIGTNIVTFQIIWERIWMSCVVESTGQMQCKAYDSLLALSPDMQAARALMVISIVVGITGILMALVSGKCTNSIINDFYNPLSLDAQRRELGAPLFLGWAAGLLLVLGGGLLCTFCTTKANDTASVTYNL